MLVYGREFSPAYLEMFSEVLSNSELMLLKASLFIFLQAGTVTIDVSVTSCVGSRRWLRCLAVSTFMEVLRLSR
jgi:hypothetical protein